jgi:hypothetical protein
MNGQPLFFGKKNQKSVKIFLDKIKNRAFQKLFP